MWNPGLGELQAGIKTAGRNINLRYADDTTLMAEIKEEWVSLWGWKKRVEKTGLKLNIQETKMMAPGPITSWQIEGKKWKQWKIFLFFSSKSLKMVTGAL